MSKIDLKWEVGYTSDPSLEPELFVPARVPGAAQLDWAKAEAWPDCHLAESHLPFDAMESYYWVYRAWLDRVALKESQRLFLVLEGVDYQFLVKVGGETVHGQEGMFTPVALDVTGREGSEVQVLIFPPPDSGDYASGRSEARESVKPAVSYGWDFHPRLLSSGLWSDAYLEIRDERHIVDLHFDYQLDEELSQARLDLSIELSQMMRGCIEWTLTSMDGEVAEAQSAILQGEGSVDVSTEVFDPELWWPNGQGEARFYRLSVSLHDEDGKVLDSRTRRVGFRRARLVVNEGAWERPAGFPKSRSAPPMTLEINGRRIFCKGSNWVPQDLFPGLIDGDACRPLLEMAKAAHFNLLRCWGGGVVNKEAFFDLCDELGIMVWQEFPLSCNRYSESPEYLDTLDRESRSIIRRIKTHPCLAVWCGGNELFNVWSGMTDQHKALRLLNRNCYELDPDTPFLPTSPVMGVGHGGYLFRDANGVECFELFQKAKNSAYVEFGCPGPASPEVLRTFLSEEELFPPKPGGAWASHHGFGAWEGAPGAWLCLDVIEHYFGKAESIDELVGWGQLLQGEGYKAMFEEARRQKPYCSMALSWCFNEPWPTAANNSIVSWPSEPKPAYEAVRQSCRPVLASARAPRFLWSEGDWFEAELWMLNDTPQIVKGHTVEAYLLYADDEVFMLSWDYEALEPQANGRGPTLRYRLPAFDGETFVLALRVEGRKEWNSEYVFAYHPLNPMMSG